MSSSLVRLQRIFADLFTVPEEEIIPSTSPETLQLWDSLQHLNLMLAIEQEFGVQITPQDMEQLTSVNRIAAYLDRKCQTEGNGL
jgi:acyl carrier protein